MKPSRDISRLIEIMAALRTPDTGCPWDLEQTFATIAPYTVEEAHEVAEAIARGDFDDLRDELGDLLLQVVFHARMAEESGLFDFGAVVEAITSKLIRRHPHVFGDARDLSPEEVSALWGLIKAQEKAARPGGEAPSLLASVGAGQPALARAEKLQKAASKVGFDWNDARLVLAKIREEVEETAAAVETGARAAIEDEIGDLLFAVVNLARHAKVDAEHALRGTNAKFERRFAFIERALADLGKRPENASLAEMDALWNAAKVSERASD